MSWGEMLLKLVTPSKPRHSLFVSESASALFHEQIRYVYEALLYSIITKTLRNRLFSRCTSIFEYRESISNNPFPTVTRDVTTMNAMDAINQTAG